MKIKLDSGAFMPEYAHEQDAGMDLRSPINAVVLPHDSAIIHTGIHVEIPHGHAGFLKSKSGLNVNHDITSEGVIDEGYTGSIPIYTTATRGGCWFCHNQGVEQLRLLRKNYPELWALMLKWDADSPVSFKADGHTVHDYDDRFRIEDEGLIPENQPFRWSVLNETQLTAEWYITHGGDNNARTGSL